MLNIKQHVEAERSECFDRKTVSRHVIQQKLWAAL